MLPENNSINNIKINFNLNKFINLEISPKNKVQDKAIEIISNLKIVINSNCNINLEPRQWFNIKKNRQNKLTVKVSKGIRKTHTRGIYALTNLKTGQTYFGKSNDPLERVTKHLTQSVEFLNELPIPFAKKTKYQQLFEDLNTYPFAFGVVHYISPYENLNPWEKFYIALFKAMGGMDYNTNSGGGGGESASLESKDYHYLGLKDEELTPKKKYKFKKNPHTIEIQPDISPSFNRYSRINRVLVYQIKNEETNERYIGYTSRGKKRISEHCRETRYMDPNHPYYNPRYKASRLAKQLAKDPEKFTVGYLPIKRELKTKTYSSKKYQVLGNSVGATEKEVIKLKNSYYKTNPLGLNLSPGGNGTISHLLASYAS